MQDKLKEAFQKIRQDIDFICSELLDLKSAISELKNNIHIQNSAQIPQQQTDNRHKTIVSTMNYQLEPLKSPNLAISTGNRGVSTDRQHNRQTDNNPLISHGNPFLNNQKHTEKVQKTDEKTDKITNFQKVSEILNSLDEIKKEVRFKFKKLTVQEMQVFSALYDLEEKGFIVDYALLSQRLSLTESSIRDYILRIIKKGIPIEKQRENNKRIILSVSPELRKIASLETIYQLRAI